MEDFALMAIAQVDTSTASITIEESFALFGAIWQAFKDGVVPGLLAIATAIFGLTRIGPLQTWIDATPADWVLWAVRAAVTLGGAVIGGWAGGITGVIGTVTLAAPAVTVYIRRTITEFND